MKRSYEQVKTPTDVQVIKKSLKSHEQVIKKLLKGHEQVMKSHGQVMNKSRLLSREVITK